MTASSDAGPTADPTAPDARTGPARQLFALAAGPTAWMIHLVGGSVLVPAACARNLGWTIDLLTATTGAACIIGVIVSARLYRPRSAEAAPDSGGVGFVGYLALTANLISLALVLGEGAMHWFVEVCR